MNTLSPIGLNEFQETETEKINLLIFSIMETRFGVDLDNVYELLEPEQANRRECNLVPFDKYFSFREPVHYRSPMALLLKETPFNAIMIDQVQEIAQVFLDAIKPLPTWMKKYNKQSTGIWATALIKNEVILLVEFH